MVFQGPSRSFKRPAFDDVSPGRRRNMQANRGKDTAPEIRVRQMLHAMGYRFRLHRKDLPGRPDIVFPTRNKIVEVRGCFWHRHAGCAFAAVPATRAAFWQAKFQSTVARDAANLAALANAGWKVMVLWECELAEPEIRKRLRSFLGPPGRSTRGQVRVPESAGAV